MMYSELKIKKWGNSLGVVIPKEIVGEMKLKEEEIIVININRKKKKDAFGLFKKVKGFEREEDLLDRF